MIDNKPINTGHCRCGEVTFEARCEPIMTSACHCRGCQRMTGSAFSLTALFPIDGFVVTKGSPVIGGLRGATQHFFCPDCLSWLFTRPADTDAFVGVRSSLFDNPEGYAPFMETWTQTKLRWAGTGANVSFEAFPEASEYPALMAAFRQFSS